MTCARCARHAPLLVQVGDDPRRICGICYEVTQGDFAANEARRRRYGREYIREEEA